MPVETSAAKKSPPDYGEFVAHPAADIFPLMRPDDLRRLADDIKEHGQLDDIEILAGTKQIVDGRNRYLACRRADVEPRTAEVSTDGMPYGVYEYVVSKNLLRRQLTAAQRQAVVKKLRESGQSIRAIAETTGIPRATVARDVRELAQSGHLDQPERIEGKDGRSRPAAMPPKLTLVADEDAGETHVEAALKPLIEILESPDAKPSQALDLLRAAVGKLEGFADGLQLVSIPDDVSADEMAQLTKSMRKGRTAISQFIKRLEGDRPESPGPEITVNGDKPSAKVVNDWLRSVGRKSEVTRGKVSNALIAEYVAANAELS